MNAAEPLRIVLADDERPARLYLRGLLEACDDVHIVGEATNGTEAVSLIEREHPDLALLDLRMPELDGIDVIRVVRTDLIPLVAFVTAYDAYAVRAFELNAVDYLLKPVEAARLRHTLNRAHDRLAQRGTREDELQQVVAASSAIVQRGAEPLLRRIPVRRRDDIIFVSIDEVASIVADGELLWITTMTGDRYTINYRLKDLESRLDTERFIRLSRSAVVNIDAVAKVSPLPGGTYVMTLANKQQLGVSRIQARTLRETLLRL